MTTKTSNWVFVNIKPLSANEAFAPRARKAGRFYRGEIYKTAKYKTYERQLFKMLPALDMPAEGKLSFKAKVFYSRSTSDLDNFLKPFLDVLQKNYGFDDKRIYKILIKKSVVKKGEEGIHFCLEAYEEDAK